MYEGTACSGHSAVGDEGTDDGRESLSSVYSLQGKENTREESERKFMLHRYSRGVEIITFHCLV